MCSVFEAVLYSLSVSHVELMQEKHPRQSEMMRAMKENIEQPITAILTLNTIANTIGAAVAGAAAVAVFGQGSLIWFSLVFTLAILLFSEILPKTIGVIYAKQLGPHITLPLHLMIIVLKPIIVFCQAITRLVPQQDASQQVSAKEVLSIARLSLKSGQIEQDQEIVITNILKLKNKTVRQVMTPRTVTFMLDKHLDIREASQFENYLKMHSRVPVFDKEQDNIEGIVLSQHIFMEAAENKYKTKLSEIMNPVYFIPETAPLNRVFIDFFERHQHLFVVVDEYGSVTGVISMEDIIEEIMGREIVDESDKARDMRELARQSSRLWQKKIKHGNKM
jgi:CBS domain containing-hemolysin-like protein